MQNHGNEVTSLASTNHLVYRKTIGERIKATTTAVSLMPYETTVLKYLDLLLKDLFPHASSPMVDVRREAALDVARDRCAGGRNGKASCSDRSSLGESCRRHGTDTPGKAGHSGSVHPTCDQGLGGTNWKVTTQRRQSLEKQTAKAGALGEFSFSYFLD